MRRLPIVQGVIERRILANFRIDPEVLARTLPKPFRPKLAHGWGVAGICLIRLGAIRPRFVPAALGMSSENAAHRVAVGWDDPAGTQHGVYIPRRDTSSRLNALVGGRIFPGEHHLARFEVRETATEFFVSLREPRDGVAVLVEARVARNLPSGSVFHSLEEASAFFESGALGYSATARSGQFDGLELRSLRWRVEPLEVTRIESTYLSDSSVFPAGSVQFDCALLMRNIEHEWHSRATLCADAAIDDAHPNKPAPNKPEKQIA